jgi:hypothetical protein
VTRKALSIRLSALFIGAAFDSLSVSDASLLKLATPYWSYNYEASKDTLRIRYSTFPRHRNVRDQIASKDEVRAASFMKRFEIWLITSVLIHCQDTQSDLTALGSADLEQEKIDDLRR